MLLNPIDVADRGADHRVVRERPRARKRLVHRRAVVGLASPLSNELPRVRRMLAEDGGVGSAAVYSSHKLLPYFGFRGKGLPLSCMDHGAPIFA